MTKTLNPDQLRGLKPHKLAGLFPMIEGAAFVALRDDIKSAGKVREPIYLCNGAILDGRNRVKAAVELNMHVDAVDVGNIAEAEARALVMSLNLHRRHLTAEQQRHLILNELKDNPGASDRATAENVTAKTGAKVNHKQVGRVRKDAERTGTVSQLSGRTGKDGKTRTAPTTGTVSQLMPDANAPLPQPEPPWTEAQKTIPTDERGNRLPLGRDFVPSIARMQTLVSSLLSMVKQPKYLDAASVIAELNVITALALEAYARELSPTYKEAAEALDGKARELDRQRAAVGYVMTHDELQTLRSLCHPDKNPGNEAAASKAMAVLNKLNAAAAPRVRKAPTEKPAAATPAQSPTHKEERDPLVVGPVLSSGDVGQAGRVLAMKPQAVRDDVAATSTDVGTKKELDAIKAQGAKLKKAIETNPDAHIQILNKGGKVEMQHSYSVTATDFDALSTALALLQDAEVAPLVRQIARYNATYLRAKYAKKVTP